MTEEKKDIQIRLLKDHEDEKAKKEEVTEILRHIAPGTSLRTAIDGVLKAKTGGLIIVENELVSGIIEGGFKVNCRFTPQRMIELCKMDGAMVLSKDMKKILFANALLTPDHSINSNETGTRHKSAERSAKQTKTMVIAVSQRRDEIALFYKDFKYVIRNTNEIIRRATEVLQILEKHREMFEKIEKELNVDELKRRYRIIKAVSLMQRGRIILKISEILKRYLIELGTEGTIVKTRLKEILYGIEKEINNTIKDYSKIGLAKSKRILNVLSYDEILESDNIKKCLGFLNEKDTIIPKGHRLLSKAVLNDEEIGILIGNLKNLDNILGADLEKIKSIFTDDGERIFDRIKKIKEEIYLG